MTIVFTSPIAGGAQTGFTSPTYTVTADTSAPNPRTKQVAVTSLGGTQSGVRTSTVSDPFTVGYTPPANLKVLPQPNPVTGKYPPIPFNVHQFNFRKGMNFATNQIPLVGYAELRIGIPAGAESADPANIRALASLIEGSVAAFVAGLGDTLVTGIP
ncbi:coat protein [ssRNA phage Zoerhiza.2_8]|uniref:Coat protein n=2 Tax=Norzivirales TaxID=2842247 RepID=A0A8S5L2X9_9VIRU|nr:coat protein [ssRNA phage Zoerhiza.2_8]QDH89234.1 MAG: hypothetical protein H2Rhizo31581_000003 [Leviviridae sp.]DAD52000.1 TPA_asm: coat protein [ssRNA phage Zoerhiza.2_8]